MSFITESKKAYKQVKENHVAIAMGNMLDDEGSMILNQLEELERGIEMLRTYVGNDYEKQLPAWVQSKVTLATDYISTVGNYLSSKNEKATEESIKESFSLEENTFEKIYQMQQDGKSTEDIAKELKLNPALVKKVLGENTIISEGLSDTQISQLKKEYEPLKGKTITTSQYQQLKNILFKLQDGDLEKLQKQNIPFASTGAGSILRVRKSPVKITSVKVPGLEGMAEENQYVAVHVKKGKTSVTANSSYEAAKKASEKFGLNNTTGITVMLAKKDGEDVIHKATEEVKVTEEKIDLQEKPSRKKHVVFKVDDKLVAKDFRGYNDDEIAKSIDDFLKQNSKSIVVQQSPIQSVTEEPKNPYAIGMAAAMKATGDTPPLKKSTITKAHKIADKVKEEEVSKEKETEFHKKLDTLVHKTFGKRKDEKMPVKESTSRNINEGARALVEAIAALQKKADKSGMPYSILKQVYDRGMAAWKGGHRPGAGQHQWAFARVNSFVTKSSGTWGGADSDLAKKVKGKE
jgi:hypothetical protein